MNVKKYNYTKVNCQTDIKKKQAMWNRFKRRFNASNNPTEKRFLKIEATRVCTELKQWSKRWQNWGFGGYTWITKNFNVSCFSRAKMTAGRKATSCKSSTSKSYGSRTSTGSYRGRSSSSYRPKSRTRTSAARKSYTAW